MKKKTVICLDRDGTLIYDDKYHLGRTTNWRSKVKILPSVVKGIKQLRKIPNVKLYMITNQPGVATKTFPLLTLQRAHEVCRYVLKKLESKKAGLDGYFLCPHASPSYTRKRKERTFDTHLVCNCSCIKPKLGMVFNALKAEGVKKKDVNIYVIGDRASDVKTATNVKGIGILVPFKNGPEQKEIVKKIKGKTYIAKNFTDAVEYEKKRCSI